MIAAIVLAAGDSTRMGRSKALLELDGKYFIDIILTKIHTANYNKIIVVLGRQYESIQNSIRFGKSYTLLKNENPQEGQLSSLKLAIAELESPVQGSLMALVDHPLVSQSTYFEIHELAIRKPESIIIPTFKNKRGHPVYFGNKFFTELLEAPLEKGAKYVVNNNQSQVIELALEDEGIIRDIDTPEEYNIYGRNL
jgi:molybdenum cofactor cytidylyltransferase